MLERKAFEFVKKLSTFISLEAVFCASISRNVKVGGMKNHLNFSSKTSLNDRYDDESYSRQLHISCEKLIKSAGTDTALSIPIM